MKFLGTCIPGIFLVLAPLLAFSTHVSLQFYEGTWEELQSEASGEKIPYLVYFYQEDLAACKKMSRETFGYEPLVEFADGHYLPFRMSAGEAGEKLASPVETIPSIGVYGPEGQQWGLIRGYISGPELLLELQKLRRKHLVQLPLKEEVPLTSRLRPISRVQPDDSRLSRGQDQERSFLDPISEKEIAQVELAAGTSPAITVVTVEKNPAPSFSAPRLSTLWKEQLGWAGNSSSESDITLLVRYDLRRHHDAQPFGIEVGRFPTEAELKARITYFEKVWKSDMWVYKERIEGEEVFRLILGSYESTEEALAFATPMRKIAQLDVQVVDFRYILKPSL